MTEATTPEWDGVTQGRSLNDEWVPRRHAFADAARDGRWTRVFEYLDEVPQWVNVSRPDGPSWFAPLHQAAYLGAPVGVVDTLVARGAWRTLQDARGARPIDIAVAAGHQHLIEALTPVIRHAVPPGILIKLQQHLHDVIRRRAADLIDKQALRLPELEPMLEMVEPLMWFPVPGMYGGFRLLLRAQGLDSRLHAESWSRVAGGSGQRHEITAAGARLVEEGFV